MDYTRIVIVLDALFADMLAIGFQPGLLIVLDALWFIV